ncbi:hypothetical protein F3N42_09730 [Marinihelvus fidelis]|uniref:Uncharacterized protein n=1 Tax=Marinihelvus fidelis TaxID=2613842 RepID=A0A5N0T988_9GAMM|nr:hypothetical protein [Marinihelvus fidelis]KAA9131585.1 hypothetical protein F3N42_09730 [Marinihelvus fidelis]
MEDQKSNIDTTTRREPCRKHASGSWWSHAAYGFGVSALFLPFMVPGVPARTLIVIYFVLVTTAMLGLMAWGVAREIRAGLRSRGRRRRLVPGRHHLEHDNALVAHVVEPPAVTGRQQGVEVHRLER